MASTRSLNFESVQFTPGGGSAINIINVLSIDQTDGGSILAGRGDNNLYATHKRYIAADPGFTITHQGRAAQNSISPGSKGTLTFIVKDADNVAGTLATGDVTFSVANALIGSRSFTRAHNQYGQFTIPVETWSSDGQTNPVSMA